MILEGSEIDVCIYVNHSDTKINAHNLLHLTTLWMWDIPQGLDL